MFDKNIAPQSSRLGKAAQIITLSAASFLTQESLLNANEQEPPALPVAAAEKETVPGTTVERTAVLEKIKKISGAITEGGSTAEEKRAAIEGIRPLIQDYCKALTAASDFTIAELTLAKDVNYGTVNFTFRASGLPAEERAAYVTDLVIPFYEAQVPALNKLADENPEQLAKVNTLLSSIQTDIRYCLNYNTKDATISAAHSTIKLFSNPDAASLSDIQNLLNDNQQLYSLVILQDQKEILEKLIPETIKRRESLNPDEYVTATNALLTLNEAYTNALKQAGSQYLSPAEIEATQHWLNSAVAKPIFDDIILFYERLYEGKSAGQNTLSEQALPDLIAQLDESKITLGNQYLNQLELHCKNNACSERFKLEAYKLLLHLAPDPDRLDFITSDIETLLLTEHDSAATAPKIVTALGSILFSSLHYEMLSEDSTFKGAQHTTTIGNLLDSSIPPAAASPALLPQHQLLTKILRTGLLENIETGFPELTTIDYQARVKIEKTCKAVTLLLLADLTHSGPRELYQDRKTRSLQYITAPERWGQCSISLPDDATTEQQKRFEDAAVGLYQLGNIGALKLTAVPKQLTHQELLEHMVRVIDTTEFLTHVGNPTATDISRNMSQTFPYLSLRATDNGPFEHVFLRAQNILYQHTYQKEAPPSPPQDAILARVQWRDAKLDSLALEYARTAQERFFCDLATTLYAQSKEQRPIEGHQILSDFRMQKHIAILFARYNAIDSIAYEKSYNANEPGRNSLATILLEAPEANCYSALQARSAFLKQKQVAQLKNFRGRENTE